MFVNSFLVGRKEQKMNFVDANANALIAFALMVIAFALSYLAFGRENKKTPRHS